MQVKFQNNPIISFKMNACSYDGTKYANCGTDGVVKTTTMLFRDDIDWDALAMNILGTFSEKNRVNIYSMACSDGTEAYTLAISLLNYIDKNQRPKYFPIIGCDINSELIRAAKSGRINLPKSEAMQQQTGLYSIIHSNFEDEDVPIPMHDDALLELGQYSSYRPVRELQGTTYFMQKDMLTAAKNIQDDSNTVVLCRNVMPYLNTQYQIDFYNTLVEKLKPKSIVALGSFDKLADFYNIIEKQKHFTKVAENIFKRI